MQEIKKFQKLKMLSFFSGLLFLAACAAPAAPVAPEAPGVSPETPIVDGGGGVADHVEDIVADFDPDHPLAALFAIQAQFPNAVVNNNPAIQGGTLRVGLPVPTPPSMLYNAILHRAVDDSRAMQFFAGGSNAAPGASVFDYTAAFQFGQSGIVTWTLDHDTHSMTLTQVEDVYWHDGVPLTLGDLVFAYYTIAHPDYTGIRWGDIVPILGTAAYRAGDADHIAGLDLSADERTLTITFEEDHFSPSLLHAGFWSSPIPRHIFEGVPVAELEDHPAVRVNPIGWGPFIVQNIVPGESVHMIANENYVWGRPLVDELILQFVSFETAPLMLQAGELDILLDFPLDTFPDFSHLTNVQFLGDLSPAWNWVSFRLGTWNSETAQIEVNPDARLADVRVRRAMGFAVNEQAWTDSFWNGLRFPATGPIPPNHSAFLNPDIAGFGYDPDRARAYLDEAGFIDITGDGYREDPNGEPFTIIFAHSIAPGHDLMAQFYIQSWADVGLRVELFENRLHDFASIQENLYHADNWPEVDIHAAAWSAGFDPNPSGIWGHTLNNRPRYINAELQHYMDLINSEQAWDSDWLIEQYHAWQEAFYRAAPVIPTQWRIALNAANNRVIGYGMEPFREDGLRTVGGWHRVALSSDTAYAH